MRPIAMMFLVASLGGCAMPIEGKHAFLDQAPHRTGTFAMAYQPLFACFSERAFFRPDSLRSIVLPDLGRAEVMLVRSDDWIYLAEFVRLSDTETRVDIRHVHPSIVAEDWAAVEACAAKG